MSAGWSTGPISRPAFKDFHVFGAQDGVAISGSAYNRKGEWLGDEMEFSIADENLDDAIQLAADILDAVCNRKRHIETMRRHEEREAARPSTLDPLGGPEGDEDDDSDDDDG